MLHIQASGAKRSRRQSSADRPLLTLLAITIPTVWFVSVAFLAIRRGLGEMSQPLPLGGVVLTAIALVVLSLLGHRCIRFAAGSDQLWLAHCAFLLLFGLSAFALAVPGTGWLSLGLFCLIVGIPATMAAANDGLLGRRHQGFRTNRADSEADVVTGETPAASTKMGLETDVTAIADDQSIVTQRLTRSIEPDGRQTVAGEIRAEFPAGTAATRLHIGFCPPLPAVPEVFLELADGPDCSMRVAQVQVNGIRIDVSLPEPSAENTSATLELYAVSPLR